MVSVPAQYRFLGPKPKSKYRQLFIAGTRIMARVLYGRYMSREDPATAEQIAADYGLPVEAVREAIAYCQGGPAEIAEDARMEEETMEAVGANDPGYRLHPHPRPRPMGQEVKDGFVPR
jgi:uncharacterized protein (DUF433 family)